MAHRTFAPAFVHDIAAQLFWRLAEQVGIDTAKNLIESSGGTVLGRQPFVTHVLAEYEDDIPEKLRPVLLTEVADEALEYHRREKVLLGSFYVEDVESGRSPSATDIDTSNLARRPSELIVDPTVPTAGRLVIRHPLPAVVVTDKPHSGTLLRIEDTTTALGFDYPLFLGNMEEPQPLPNGQYLLIGELIVPVPDSKSADDWSKVSIGTIRFFKGLNWLRDEKLVEVAVVKW